MTVIIAGGGPAGCTAAIYLAREGFDVKLYEKNSNKPKACGGGLSWRVVREFKEFLKDIPLNEIKDVTFDFEENIYEVSLNKSVGCITQHFIFEKHLRSIAQSEGVKVINKKLENFSNKNITIDATGHKKGKNQAMAIVGFCKAKNHNMFIMFRRKLIKVGYFWVFPMSDNLVNIGVGGVVKSFNVNPMVAFNWFLKKIKLKIYNVSAAPLFYSEKISKLLDGNIIKVGEAAGLINPLTAEGIYYAMKSGKIAAECISKDMIEDYENKIKNKFKNEFTVSKYLRSLILTPTPIPIANMFFKFGVGCLKSKFGVVV